MGLNTSLKGFKLNLQSNALHFWNMLETLSALSKVGTPCHCLLQADLGEKLNLVCFTNHDPESNASRPFLDSNIGPLFLSSVYDSYSTVLTDNTTGVLYVMMLNTVNNF